MSLRRLMALSGSSGAVPQVIGDIVTPTYVSGDYTDNGLVSHGIVGGKLRIQGTDAAAFGKYVTFDNWLTDREYVTVELYNYAAYVAAGSIGIGPCLSSAVGGSLYQHIGLIGLDTTSGNRGNVYVMDTTAGSSSILDQTNPDAAFVDNADDLIIRITRAVNNVTVTVINNTKILTKSIDFDYIYGATNAVSLITPSSKIGFYFFGGIHEFNWRCYTPEYNLADLILLGDSKSKGYSVGGTSNANIVAELFRAAYPGKNIYCQGGINETTNEMVARLDDLELSLPKQVVLMSLSNDERNGVLPAVSQANLNTIRNRVESWGGVFRVCNPLLEIGPGGIDLTPQIAMIAGVTPALNILTYPTFDPNTGTSADGFHLNTVGSNAAFNDINGQITI